MIFHISSRVASRSALALLSPVPLTGCSVADTWSQRNQSQNPQAHPYPTARFPTSQRGRARTQQTADDPTEGRITLLQYHPLIRAEGVSHAKGGVPQQLLPNEGCSAQIPSQKKGHRRREGKTTSAITEIAFSWDETTCVGY